MIWYVRYNGRVVRMGKTGPKLTIKARDAEQGLSKARLRGITTLMGRLYDPRLIEVFNHTAPPPDPHAGDEGRAWWMERGL